MNEYNIEDEIKELKKTLKRLKDACKLFGDMREGKIRTSFFTNKDCKYITLLFRNDIQVIQRKIDSLEYEIEKDS